MSASEIIGNKLDKFLIYVASYAIPCKWIYWQVKYLAICLKTVLASF